MKHFTSHSFSAVQCRTQVDELKKLLDSQPELKERTDILPFFRKRTDLTAFIASSTPDLDRYDLLAYEFDLFGTFSCDVVIGDSKTKRFLFVEFEDAKHDSIFVKRKNRDTPEWAPRFEHGASQVIDWFWILSDMRQTDQFEQIFGARDITMNGMVILGRSDDLDIRETKRLRWRQDKVTTDSKHISCLTFDQLYEDLSFRICNFPAVRSVEGD